MIHLDEKGKPLTEYVVKHFENVIGNQLPGDYRDFLKITNGGSPSPNIVDIYNLDESPTDIQVFFGLDRSIESSNIQWNLDAFSSKFPQGSYWLPIACDSGGNLFCINLTGQDNGSVIYVAFGDNYATAHHVAPDFMSFLSMIRDWR